MGKPLTQKSALWRAKDAHGDNYDLSELVYTKKLGLVKIGCSKHGWFDITYRDFTRKVAPRGCQKCSQEIYLESRVYWNAISRDDAEKRLKTKYPCYTFNMETYTVFSRPMEVVCNLHGTFVKTPSLMCNEGQGCPVCSSLANTTKRTKQLSERVDSANNVFADKFDYIQVPPNISNKTNFLITCKTHNHTFETNWNRHLSKGGLGGCPLCYKEKMRETHLQDTEDFVRISKANQLKDYGYSRSVYVDHKTPVEIECFTHGFFWQRADKHKIGQGCDLCVKNGFRNEKSGHLYVLQDNERVKVGITNRKVKTRISEINTGGGKFSLVSDYYYDSGYECRKHETELLNYMRSLYKNTEGSFDGVTESFEDVDISLVLQFIEQKRELYGRENI